MQDSNYDEILGKKVAFFRSRMNWPLKTLAAYLGVSIQQLQRYEKGVNKISAGMLYELANIFKVDVGSFFEDFKPQNPDEPKKVFNVLLIEDNANDEFIIRQALGDFDKKLSIHSINDGQDALTFLNGLGTQNVQPIPKPDIIFLDLHLPSLRGFDILKSIKKRPYLQKIPVIILSSSLSPDDRINAYNLQSSGFIRKSFNFEEFKNQLHKAMMYWSDVVELPQGA